MSEQTQVQVSKETRQKLRDRRFVPREPYDSVIRRLIRLADKERSRKD